MSQSEPLIETFHQPKPSYDVVLSGAGISVTWPSAVPAGDSLMRATWGRLLRTGLTNEQLEILKPVTAAVDRPDAPPIVLEALAQILLEHIGDQDLVVSTYVEVGTDAVNSNHLKLASLTRAQITLNMDHLLERAGASVWHLHGEWDDRKSIVTFASQYRSGLPREDQDRLIATLEGASVLVVGYSGRDIDVMPLLMRSRPAQLHWMHFGGKLEPTVVRLKAVLGDRMTIFDGGVDQIVHADMDAPTPTKAFVPAADRFDEIPRFSRILAAAAVASDIGQDPAALRLLESIRMIGEKEIVRRKLIARIASRRQDYSVALRTLLWPSVHASTLRAMPKVLNEVAEALPRTGHPGAAHVLNTLLTHVPRAADSARIRLARQAQIAGRLVESRDILLSIAERPDIHESISVAGLVDALTALSDGQKMLGEYDPALRSAKEAVELTAYANPSQRDATLRRLAEIAHVRGETEVTVPGSISEPIAVLLERIYDDAASRDDQPTMFWSAATAADVASREGEKPARNWLARAGKVMPTRSPVADLYLGLISVEVERLWVSVAQANSTAEALFAAQSGPSRQKPTASSTIARLAVVSTAVGSGRIDGLDESVTSVVADARALGMRAIEARAELVGAELTGARIDETRRHEWLLNGWLWEASAATAAVTPVSGMAWPVVL